MIKVMIVFIYIDIAAYDNGQANYER